jgi:hypothetical protein
VIVYLHKYSKKTSSELNKLKNEGFKEFFITVTSCKSDDDLLMLYQMMCHASIFWNFNIKLINCRNLCYNVLHRMKGDRFICSWLYCLNSLDNVRNLNAEICHEHN